MRLAASALILAAGWIIAYRAGYSEGVYANWRRLRDVERMTKW